MAGHLVGVGRHAVEHEAERGAAVARGVQELPGHGVGVAGGGGHEQPRVGGGQELTGQVAVGLDHRVDVGGVEQRQAGRQRVARSDLHAAAVGRSADGAAQPRKHALILEPANVGGMAHEHRRARGGPQNAGGADLDSHEAVHEGRFARTGGPAHHQQQRRVHLAQAGKQIVADLAGELAPQPPALGRVGHLQGHLQTLELLAELSQRLRDGAGIVSHRRLPIARTAAGRTSRGGWSDRLARPRPRVRSAQRRQYRAGRG